MGGVVTAIARLAAAVGFIVAIGAQICALVRIAKRDSAKAVLALVVPGYLIYYVWRSDEAMPGLLKVWLAGFLLMVFGLLVFAVVVEM